MGQKTPSQVNRKAGNKKTRKSISIIVFILMMLVAAGFLAMIILVDAFPQDLLTTMLTALFVTLVIGGILLFRRRKWLRAIGLLTAVIFIAFYGICIYYMGTTYAMFARITADNEEITASADGLDVTKEAFNIYVTGIDQWNKTKGLDLERSDVNMIITVSPKTRKLLLTSIPRDAYVPLHRTGTMDKLTHTGIYGVDETLNTVEDWTGLDINYYVKANFNACVDLVEAIGGIDIYNPVEFRSALTDHLYEKGNIHLKGYGALYFARERKAFEGEDQLRVKNQLIVMEAILDKIMTSSTLLTSYADIMNVLGEEVETDMPAEDIQALIKMQLSDMRSWDITTQRMTGEYDMEIVASMDPSNSYLVLKVDPESFDACLEAIDRTMNPTPAEIEELEMEKRQSALTSFKEMLKDKILGSPAQSDEEADNGEE